MFTDPVGTRFVLRQGVTGNNGFLPLLWRASLKVEVSSIHMSREESLIGWTLSKVLKANGFPGSPLFLHETVGSTYLWAMYGLVTER